MKALTRENTAFKKTVRKTFDNCCDWFMTAIATTAFDKFNMTDDEVVSFMNNVKEIADSIVKDYCSVEDLKQILKEDYNFTINLVNKEYRDD